MTAISRVLKGTATSLLAALIMIGLTFQVGTAQESEKTEQAMEKAKNKTEKVQEEAKADVAMQTPDQAAPEGNIVAVLTEEGDYTWLVSALERTGLDRALEAEGPFTLFAPTDEAVSDPTTKSKLESMDQAALVELLRTHLLVGKVTEKQAATLGDLATVQGESLTASQSEDAISINDATIVDGDLQASNGVIHGIDGVLMPAAETTEPTPNTGS